MRNLILQEFVTIDGMAAALNGGTDFIPDTNRGDRSLMRRQLELLDSIDAILLGRKTYEMFVNYWPQVTEGDDKAFADRINATPKIVFSQSLDHAPWGNFAAATVVKTSAAKEIERLKQLRGKDMVLWGSISLAQSLIHEGLIDEYRIVICPTVLGEGRRLFDETTPGELHLLSTEAYDRGSVLLSYSGAMASANV
jgi:dihydrofolate reductase